jgi:hypothetical protein
MTPEPHFTDIAHTIQLAVAPVFLLSALGTILGVLSTRLGRIVDRTRVLAGRMGAPAEGEQGALREEMALLARRRRLVNLAITSGTVAALLVCLLIASAFVGFMLHADFSVVVALLFVAAMAAFVVALLLFLREVLHAVGGVRIAPPEGGG